jgi:DNA-binding CsgD family transcriptional regulator
MKLDSAHIFFDVQKEVKSIFKPLFRYTPLTHCDYQRQYYDGSSIFLFGSLPQFLTEYLRKEVYPTLSELFNAPSSYVFLANNPISEEIDFYSKYHQNIQLSQEVGIQHRLCILQHYEKYCDIFCFGNNQPLEKMLNFYINNTKLLEKFISYFNEAAYPLIQLGEKNKIKIDNFIDLNEEIVSAKPEDIKFNELLEAIKLKRYHLTTPKGIVKITRRELECLKLTAQRFSAKESAKMLNLSPRTVEDYLENLKTKFGYTSKFDLIDLANKNDQVKSLINLL